MLRTDYEAVRALVDLRLREIERQVEVRHTLRVAESASPEWVSSLCGWLGTLLVRVGRRLEAYHLQRALVAEQA